MTVQYRRKLARRHAVQITVEDTGIGIAPEHCRASSSDSISGLPMRGLPMGPPRMKDKPTDPTKVPVLGWRWFMNWSGNGRQHRRERAPGHWYRLHGHAATSGSRLVGLVTKVEPTVDCAVNPSCSLGLSVPTRRTASRNDSATEERLSCSSLTTTPISGLMCAAFFEADYQIIEAEDGQDGLERATVPCPIS